MTAFDWSAWLAKQPLTRFDGTTYRFHNPVWAWSPLSGEGAARCGGRFNPPDTPALYMAASLHAAIAEITGGYATKLLDPQVLCTYHVEIDNLIDLRGANAPRFAPAWRVLHLQGKTPPGWALCRVAIQHSNINGFLVQSYQSSAESNVVLLRYSSQQVCLHDPDQRLLAVYGEQLKVSKLRPEQ